MVQENYFEIGFSVKGISRECMRDIYYSTIKKVDVAIEMGKENIRN